MIVTETRLSGVRIVTPEPAADERGSFARIFEADRLGPVTSLSMSVNRLRGTLRGLHHQRAPHAESKLVRCTSGAIWDVAVDLASGAWFGLELSSANGLALWIPPGFAHGFVTLEDATEVLYAIDAPHEPDAAAGIRWDDPALGIEWPIEPTVISAQDERWPLL